MRHQFTMGIERMQKTAAVGVAHGAGYPGQIVIARGQHMGLLVVEVLDTVLHTAQKHIRPRQCIGRLLGHEPRLGEALQRIQRGPATQFGELPAAHHLQQLHGELDFADAAARQLHIVGALRMSGAALGGVLADLPVQGAQRVKHAVVQITAEHERQHHAAQRQHFCAADSALRRHHPALEPGKTLPFAALYLQVFLQRRQRHRCGAGIAMGPQGQVHPEDKTMFGGVADQAVDDLHRMGKVLMVGNAAAPLGVAGRFSVLCIHIDQVDVAGHIELARTELAHADHPQGHGLPVGRERCAVAAVQLAAGVKARLVQRELCQFGDRAGNV